jgi:outer membrane protein assembly factor BamD
MHNKIIKTLAIICLTIIALISIGCATKEKSTAEIYKNQAAKEILASGEKALANKNYSDAAKHFEAIDSLYPFGDEAEIAQLKVIYAYYAGDETTSAIAAADRYIHLYPNNPHTPYAYYMKGMTSLESSTSWLQKKVHIDPAKLELKNMQNAFSSFNALIRQFPKSVYAVDAQKQMIYVRNVLAQHEVDTAKFYFDRKAYIAAINRATNVVEHYEGAPQIEQALNIMADSYHALGHEELEAATRQVIKLNFQT